MYRLLLVMLTALLAVALPQSIAQVSNNEVLIRSVPLVIGSTHFLRSSVLSEDRVLNIYLPASYSSNDTGRFPVIYLLDGGTDEDFIHIVGLVQYLNFPWVDILKESIVVGIANVDRKRDLTYPTNVREDQEDLPTQGGSARFIDFIEKEIQPYIESNFRTNNSRTILGQSLAGLLAAEILVKRPSLFTSYIIISPSLWWDNQSLVRLLRESARPPLQQKRSIYLAVGKEGKEMEEAVTAFSKALKEMEPGNPRIYFEYYPDESHATIYHRAVYKAFERLKQ